MLHGTAQTPSHVTAGKNGVRTEATLFQTFCCWRWNVSTVVHGIRAHV